jgi:hypothetical protein
MPDNEAPPARFDREITAAERLVAEGQYDDAAKNLLKVISDLRPAADLFYTSYRINQ